MDDDQEREVQDSPSPQEDSSNPQDEFTAEMDEDEYLEPESAPPGEQKPGPDPDELAALRRERDEMRAQYEKVEPFLPLFSREDFREWIEERAALGDEAVPRTPVPEPADIVEFQKNALSPEFPVIQDMVREWAQTLPEYQRAELESNHKAFNKAYRAFREAGGDQLPHSSPPAPSSAALPNTPRDRASLEAAIRAKEIIKEQARIEPPGAAFQDPVPEDPAAPYKKARARLYQARESGTPAEAAAAELRMIEAYFSGEDAPKKSRSKSW